MILNGTCVRDLFMKSCGPVSADQNTGQGTAERRLLFLNSYLQEQYLLIN